MTTEDILTMHPLGVVKLHTTTPCCKQKVILRALVDAPREQYERTCKRCKGRWTIDRTVIKEGPVRMDKLDWTCTKGGSLA